MSEWIEERAGASQSKCWFGLRSYCSNNEEGFINIAGSARKILQVDSDQHGELLYSLWPPHWAAIICKLLQDLCVWYTLHYRLHYATHTATFCHLFSKHVTCFYGKNCHRLMMPIFIVLLVFKIECVILARWTLHVTQMWLLYWKISHWDLVVCRSTFDCSLFLNITIFPSWTFLLEFLKVIIFYCIKWSWNTKEVIIFTIKNIDVCFLEGMNGFISVKPMCVLLPCLAISPLIRKRWQ